MILTEKVIVGIDKRTKEHYKNKGYNVENNEIEINVTDLIANSNCEIDVKCDICGIEKIISYRRYMLSFNNGGFYTCNKCINVKNKKTRLDIYGDENYNNRKKQKETCIKNFGVDSFTKTEEYIEKTKETSIKKFGKDFYNQTDEFKIRAKETCNKKYNKDHYSQTEESIKKAEDTCLRLYGETYYSKTKEFKGKVISTSLKKYGYKSYSSSIECRNRVKETCLKNFGVEHPMQNKEHFEKCQKKGFKLKIFKDLTYQGSYELDFINKYYDKIKITKPNSIYYEYNGKIRVYHPDFLLTDLNLIVEIKNSYLAKKDELIIEQKKNYTIKKGYNYIMIVDKNYTEFDKLVINY